MSPSTPMVDIRAASLEDARGLAAVQVDSYRTAYSALFPPSYLEQFTYAEQENDWDALLTTGAGDILLVAISPQRELIGYVLATAQPDIYPGHDAEIVALHVRKGWQRRGLGTSLLRRAVETLDERGSTSVMLWVLAHNRVRRWYEHLGGTVIGDRSYRVEGQDIIEIAYGWELKSLWKSIASRGE